MIKYVLSIETSCDDTSVAIVDYEGRVESLVSASQDEAHKQFGGVVPEIASRSHTATLLPLVDACIEKSKIKWKDISGIVVTSRPGLVGALLVGLVTAKTLSLVKKIPFLGVNHLEGHLLAPFLKDDQYSPPENFTYPYVGLAVSGGHTQLCLIRALGDYEILGKTLDDAAGEAFDKFGKMLGLGFPGGVHVDRCAAQGGDVLAYSFPRSMLKQDNLNFSFSGLKASAQRLLNDLSDDEKKQNLSSLCASFQEAIVDVLIHKLDRAVLKVKVDQVIITGGVSANSRLRERAQEWAKKKSLRLVIPPLRYCTDNAAMIGYAGIQRLNRGEFSPQDLGPSPRVYVSDFKTDGT